MNKMIFVAVAGVGLFAAGAALAEHHGHGKGASEKGGYDWEAKMEAHFAEVDANGDGNISSEEYLAYKRAKAEKAWAKHDLGDDGMLSLEEAKAHHEAKRAEMKERHHKMHGDKDGE